MMHKAAEAFIDEALTVIKKHKARGTKHKARSTRPEARGPKHEAESKMVCELNYFICPRSKV